MDSPGHVRVNANGMDGEMRQLKVRRRRLCRRRRRRRRASFVCVCVFESRGCRVESQRLTSRRRVGVASEPGRAFKSRTWVEE
jgi:hypothetical protein